MNVDNFYYPYFVDEGTGTDIIKNSWVQWRMPTIPATQDEAGRSQVQCEPSNVEKPCLKNIEGWGCVSVVEAPEFNPQTCRK